MPKIKNQKVLSDTSTNQPVDAFFAHCIITKLVSRRIGDQGEIDQIFFWWRLLKTSSRNRRPLQEWNDWEQCIVPQWYDAHKTIFNSGEITEENIIYVYFPKGVGNNQYWHLSSPAGFESSKTGIFYPMQNENFALKTFEEIAIPSR